MREKVREQKAKRRETEFPCRPSTPSPPARAPALPRVLTCRALALRACLPGPVPSPAWRVPLPHVVPGVVAALAGPCELMTRQIPCKIIQPRARPRARLPASRARSPCPTSWPVLAQSRAHQIRHSFTSPLFPPNLPFPLTPSLSLTFCPWNMGVRRAVSTDVRDRKECRSEACLWCTCVLFRAYGTGL